MDTNSTDQIVTPSGKCCCRCWIWGVVALLIWIAAIAVAFHYDARIANSVERFIPNGKTGQMESIGIINKFKLPAKIIRVPGTFPFTLVLAALLYFFHPWRWRAAAMLILAGVIGGIIYQFTKWIVGRTRPQYHEPYVFHHFPDGLPGFFSAERLSFPSGHAMLAFATAMVLSICIRRWWLLFFVLACVVGAERVLEHSHYLSDVIAGAGLGVISAIIARWALGMVRPRQAIPA